MPLEARVFTVDDDEDWKDMVGDYLQVAGHRVVATALTRVEALRITEQLAGLGVNVAVVDGNLSEGDTSGDDGRDVIMAIRQHAPEVKVIGLSSSGFVEGSDVNLQVRNVRNIGDVVNKL